MSRLARVLGIAVLAASGVGGVAQAQYYPPHYPPPPGPPGYYPPPPPGRYYDAPPGYRCDATYRTPGGPRRHLVCEIEPRPLGSGCRCPPPPPPPGYSEGPSLPGVTVR